MKIKSAVHFIFFLLILSVIQLIYLIMYLNLDDLLYLGANYNVIMIGVIFLIFLFPYFKRKLNINTDSLKVYTLSYEKKNNIFQKIIYYSDSLIFFLAPLLILLGTWYLWGYIVNICGIFNVSLFSFTGLYLLYFKKYKSGLCVILTGSVLRILEYLLVNMSLDLEIFGVYILFLFIIDFVGVFCNFFVGLDMYEKILNSGKI